MDSYATLEVAPDASTATIRAAYRRLAHQWHPDRNPTARAEANRKMAEINLAWEMLRNVETRRIVDEARRESRDSRLSSRWYPRPIPKLMSVESGCVSRIGHDGSSTLFIEYRTGGLYIYPGVPIRVWAALMHSKAQSRYVLQNIVTGPYTGKQISASASVI